MSQYVVDGERGPSDVAPKPRFSPWHGALLIGGAAILGASWLMYPGAQPNAEKDIPPPVIGAGGRFESRPNTPPPATPTATNDKPPATEPPSTQPSTATKDPLEAARAAFPLGQKDQTASQATPAKRGSGGSVAPIQTVAAQPQDTELGGKLRPTMLTGTMAAVLPHPEMTIPQGRHIDCTLETAMSSDAPGFVTCLTFQDVLGANGNVVLLEKGTQLFGEYQSQLARGRTRLFVLWTRARTPENVIIQLDSPGTDALGRAGFAGQIDTHFWARMGDALLQTTIDGAFGLGQAALSKEGSTNLNINAGRGAMRDTFGSDTSPTLEKNQGDMVAVTVARDLDFSNVYKLTTR